tara:strand:+ start:385 stop:564 length:180 start_codon:yes stop_codon:yes gene_type:complete
MTATLVAGKEPLKIKIPTSPLIQPFRDRDRVCVRASATIASIMIVGVSLACLPDRHQTQ